MHKQEKLVKRYEETLVCYKVIWTNFRCSFPLSTTINPRKKIVRQPRTFKEGKWKVDWLVSQDWGKDVCGRCLKSIAEQKMLTRAQRFLMTILAMEGGPGRITPPPANGVLLFDNYDLDL